MKLDHYRIQKRFQSINVAQVAAFLIALTVFVVSGGCDPRHVARAASNPPPVEVGVVTLAPREVTLSRELPGRLKSFRVAEVRARVDGIVLERLFVEGSEVKEGQPLFRIDPAPYRLALDRAKAQLARAEVEVTSAQLLLERYRPLLKTGTVSGQEYDDGLARLQAAKADVAAGKAAVAAARINLAYTTVKAPIFGRIGSADVTEGAYVQAQNATLLATVRQIDPMYVDFAWSGAEVLRLRHELLKGSPEKNSSEVQVRLLLDDDFVYEPVGTLQFADVSVNPSTGSISLRALFPNDQETLLPGLYARVRIPEGTREDAILIPQSGVTRDSQGAAIALMVSKKNIVERRRIAVTRSVGAHWLVASGANAGDRVIVEGQSRVRPGSKVDPVEIEKKQHTTR